MKSFISFKLIASVFLCTLSGVGTAYAADYETATKMVLRGQYAQALSQFEELAAEGNAASQYSIGLMYHLGHGVQKNPQTAYNWYKKAALQKYPRALNNIGMMYLNGEYVSQNKEVAFKLISMASPDLAIAKHNLAKCYENGLGTPQDITMAMNMYKEAGDAGYTLGWFHLGEMYENGTYGIPKDLDRAVQFYTLAAEKHLKPAHNRLVKLSRLPAHLQGAGKELASTK